MSNNIRIACNSFCKTCVSFGGCFKNFDNCKTPVPDHTCIVAYIVARIRLGNVGIMDVLHPTNTSLSELQREDLKQTGLLILRLAAFGLNTSDVSKVLEQV